MKINFILVTFLLLVTGCSSSTKFTERDKIRRTELNWGINNPLVRVLLKDDLDEVSYTINNYVDLYDSSGKIAEIKKGNSIFLSTEGTNIVIKIGRNKFESNNFILVPHNQDYVNYSNKNYRGNIKFIVNSRDKISVLNLVSVEEYLPGVIPPEMPVNANIYEAVKAFTICARTYTYMRLELQNPVFDVYPDVRSQMYLGMDAEKEISNKCVEETKDLVLTYDDKLARTFYHSTCGGNTEDARNLFLKEDLPYLAGIRDGEDPYCKISPAFTWTEEYSFSSFLLMLKNKNFINNLDYSIEDISIKESFSSGRIKLLEIKLKDAQDNSQTIEIPGNQIRTTILTSEKKSMLKSNWFTPRIEDNKVILEGRGYGHGSGFCQFGAVGQAKAGRNYKEILDHYFPGTDIEEVK